MSPKSAEEKRFFHFYLWLY